MRFSLRIPGPVAIVTWLLITFLVLFPKGGVRVAGIPLTWGYILLGLSFVPLLVRRLLLVPFAQSLYGLIAAATVVPFQLVYCYGYLQYGAENLGYAISTVTCFFFLPAVFLLVYPSFLSLVDFRRFRRQFCFCILAAAIWGIFLFFYHPIMGKYIEIPFLTVNADDYGTLEVSKHINRGGYLKLISTYNNGNLYGVATLILLPLFLKLEPALWKRNTVRIALVLTLSRSVWLGLILEQVLSVMGQLPDLLGRFPKVRPGRAMKQSLILAGTIGLVLLGTLFFNTNAATLLLDKSLGGRVAIFHSYADATFLPSIPVSGFSEVLYASALSSYGILGFLAVALIFVTPMLFLAGVPAIMNSTTRRAAGKGLILYAFVALADGATILIPVMAFYWFAYMTMLYGLPGEHGGKLPSRASSIPARWLPANAIN